MLLRFAVSNFRSIRQECELLLVASHLSDHENAVATLPGVDRGVLRAAAIYGANAAGKSNVLRALHFMRSAIRDSYRTWEPGRILRTPFLFDKTGSAEPSTFETDFFLDNTRYQYGFTLDSERVLSEWLHAYPSHRRQTWFKREQNEFTFGKFLSGENRVIKELTRSNSLFLSSAAQNNHQQLSPIYEWFSKAWRFVTEEDKKHLGGYTASLLNESARAERIRELISAADLGIESVESREEQLDEQFRESLLTFTRAVLKQPDDVPQIPVTYNEVMFRHRCADQPSVPLPMSEESEGTVAYFGLLGPVISSLSRGGVLAIDEITTSLHTRLARALVALFNSPETNPLNAQLIFTTHDTVLLGDETLRRDQIWFTEKDVCGGTHLYPLTDFKPRRGENVQNGYLAGRYGGVPAIDLLAIAGKK